MNEPDYKGAFQFITGYVVSAHEQGVNVDAASMLQSVYEYYNVLPSGEIIDKLGLSVEK